MQHDAFSIKAHFIASEAYFLFWFLKTNKVTKNNFPVFRVDVRLFLR